MGPARDAAALLALCCCLGLALPSLQRHAAAQQLQADSLRDLRRGQPVTPPLSSPTAAANAFRHPSVVCISTSASASDSTSARVLMDRIWKEIEVLNQIQKRTPGGGDWGTRSGWSCVCDESKFGGLETLNRTGDRASNAE